MALNASGVGRPPAVGWDATHPPPHLVQFYERDEVLVEAVTRFVQAGLARGEAVIVIATAAHRAALDDRTGARGRYITLDAEATLAKFMIGGQPDAARFADSVGRVVRAAGTDAVAVRAFGEMVAVLWQQGNTEAAVRLEQLWNQLARELPFSLFCAYPMSGFRAAADAPRFLELCTAHSHVIPAESYSSLSDPMEQLRAISALQQKAAALEAEAGQRRELEVALQARLDQLAEADRRKDEFLAMLGHELRNPLSAVRNAIAAASLDEARCGRALQIARRQTDQLGRLVDDLLDVARITQGRIALRRKLVSLSGVVQRAVETAQLFTEDRGHQLRVSLPTRDVWVDGDPARLEQVVVNLLSNAAKYTKPGGSIEIEVRHAGQEAVLRVRDTGIGIAPELLPYVFDLFTQADPALDRPQGGLGIGLTIVRRLVELHGGRVEARSAGTDRGAEFIVRLAALRAPAARSDAAKHTRQGAVKILVVEDNPDGAESLMMLLQMLGHQVRIVHDGIAALGAVRAEAPDVMLVDIGLPGMDGYELAARLRGELGVRDVLLVALTGYGREEDRSRALAAGFDQHLTKPVAIDSLQHLLAGVSDHSASLH
jgi:signal transduction histidine kinase/ActR/RegA family two-component response regulator